MTLKKSIKKKEKRRHVLQFCLSAIEHTVKLILHRSTLGQRKSDLLKQVTS
jgi:hypothetical protein